jgi:hypothetical protein
MISLVYGYTTSVPAEISDLISNMQEDPQWGERGVRRVDDTQLEIFGAITRTVVLELNVMLADSNRISTIRFNSTGGRAIAALSVRDIIRSRGLETMVADECMSACTTAYLGGQRRWIAETARMGFHSAALGMGTLEGANARLRDEAAKAGVADWFLDKAYSTPPNSMWFPSLEELRAGGVVTDVLSSAASQ